MKLLKTFSKKIKKNTLRILSLFVLLFTIYCFYSDSIRLNPFIHKTLNLGALETQARFPSSLDDSLLSDETLKNLKLELLNQMSWGFSKTTSIAFFHFSENVQTTELIEKVCSQWPFIELVLENNSIAINGEKPKIISTTKCGASLNFELTEPVDFINQNYTWSLKTLRFYNQKLEGFTISNYEALLIKNTNLVISF